MTTIATLAASLRKESMSVVVPQDLDDATIAGLLAADLIRVCDDEETRNDRRYEVTEYGMDVVWCRIDA
jgi:hypothetical protein